MCASLDGRGNGSPDAGGGNDWSFGGQDEDGQIQQARPGSGEIRAAGSKVRRAALVRRRTGMGTEDGAAAKEEEGDKDLDQASMVKLGSGRRRPPATGGVRSYTCGDSE